jgi:hypothetical protein
MSGQIGSGGDMSGQVVRAGRYISGQAWTRLDRSEQVVTGRDMFGHVWACRSRSVQFGICWYRPFGRRRTCRDRSAQVWTRRDNSGTVRDVSGHFGTGRDNSGPFVTCQDRLFGGVVTSRDMLAQVEKRRDMFSQVGTGR